ncbi:MAG: hypothetical protein KF700_00510 [Hyphomonadaceae bacterium]|nr:hypothetical protein [Hyphomonadaceae bacterium]
MAEFAIYRRRQNRLSRGEREWRAEPDALVNVGVSGHVRRLPWRDVVSVRLRAAPAPQRPWRYVFELRSRKGERVVLDNAHYAGEGAYEDRSASYTPFVRAALAALAAANPRVRALIGETQKRYFFLMLVALVVLGAGAYALIAAPTPFDASPIAAPVKFALVLAMLPLFWSLVLRAMPRGVALKEVPARALPPTLP